MTKQKSSTNLIMVRVKKPDNIKMLRDPDGNPYPDGEFDTVRTTYVSRRIKFGDLIDVNKINKQTKEVTK